MYSFLMNYNDYKNRIDKYNSEDMTWRIIRIQNEEILISGELNTLVQCMFHTRSQRALSRRNFWRAYGQTHAAIAVAELNKKQKRFYWWNVKIYGLCVFFKLSSGNK